MNEAGEKVKDFIRRWQISKERVSAILQDPGRMLGMRLLKVMNLPSNQRISIKQMAEGMRADPVSQDLISGAKEDKDKALQLALLLNSTRILKLCQCQWRWL